MKSSPHDGQSVTYVDLLKIAHTGTVVGQSKDGRWLYVQSDNPAAPPKQWHFKISSELIAIVQN